MKQRSLSFSPIFLIIVLSFAFSCKTTEEIKREQMVNNLSVQMVQNQRLSADTTVRLQSLEQKINNLQGLVEETDHNQQESHVTQIKRLRESLTILKEGHENIQKNSEKHDLLIVQIQKKLEDQKNYLNKVIKSLNKISKTNTPKRKGKKLGPYKQAMTDYRSARYKSAKSQFLVLLKNKKIKGKEKARLLHNMGMIEYMAKDYDQALIYFSKLITNHPKSPFNANGLLFLGKSFSSSGNKDAALQTFEELINNYPKAKQRREAKKLMKKLKK